METGLQGDQCRKRIARYKNKRPLPVGPTERSRLVEDDVEDRRMNRRANPFEAIDHLGTHFAKSADAAQADVIASSSKRLAAHPHRTLQSMPEPVDGLGDVGRRQNSEEIVAPGWGVAQLQGFGGPGAAFTEEVELVGRSSPHPELTRTK